MDSYDLYQGLALVCIPAGGFLLLVLALWATEARWSE